MSRNVGTIEYTIDAKTNSLLVAEKRSDKSFSNIERGAKKADSGVKKLNTSMKMLARVIPWLLATQAVQEFFRMADAAQRLSTKINLVTGDSKAAAQVFSDLKQISNSTGADLQNTVGLWDKLSRSLKNTSATQPQIMNLVQTIQRIGAVSGSSSEEMASAMRQFGQSMDGGILRAEEYNTLMEQMPRLVDVMASQMGLSMGQFREEMLNGKMTAERMVNALQGASSDVEKEFNKMPRTMGQAWNEVKNELMSLVSGIDNTFDITGAVTRQFRLLGKAVGIVGTVMNFARDGFDILTDGGRILIEAFDKVKEYAGKVIDKILEFTEPIAKLIGGFEKLKRAVGSATDWMGEKIDENIGEGTTSKLGDRWKETKEDIKKQIADLNNIVGNGVNVDSGNITFKPGAGGGNGGKGGAGGKSRSGGKSQEQKDREQLIKSGVQVADSYNKEIAIMKKAKEERRALDAAYAAGELQYVEYMEARKEADRAYLNGMQQERINNLVTPEQRKMGQVDPIQQLQNEWTMRRAMMAEIGATQATIKQQELAYEQQLLDLKWQQFTAQSDTNRLIGSMTDSLGNGAASAVTGLINGTQSLKESFANIGTSILNDVCGAIAQMGVDWLRENIMMEAASKATQASTTAGTVASMGAIGSAAAPAAAAVSTATMGGAAGVAMSALSAIMSMASSLFGGRRYNGGHMMGDKMYRVGEHGKPELFQSGSKQYMIPGDGGRMTSNRDAFGGGGDVINNYSITVNTTNGWSEKDSRELEATIKRISMAQIREQATRPGGLIQPRR